MSDEVFDVDVVNVDKEVEGELACKVVEPVELVEVSVLEGEAKLEACEEIADREEPLDEGGLEDEDELKDWSTGEVVD